MNSTADHDRTLASPNDRFGERFKASVSASSVQAQIIAAESRSLATTFSELENTGAAAKAAALIVGARRKFIAGEGKSAVYAGLLNSDLSATLSNVFLVDGRALSGVTILTDVRTTDVLVVFSMRRYRRESLRLGQLFKQAGGQLVVVTDSVDAPLASLADALITVHTGSASYADSPTAVAAVCHLLSALTSSSAKGARRRLADRDDLARALDLYDPTYPYAPTNPDDPTQASEPA
ncbi:MurR/RpiR family transcriptional regulator [Galactobacter sp.]|uniref:MurR/RpiR family transcriptional regulator n=1 Tax=Galactobacter sp. TaxID=2676125 RepID=UPI0025BF67CE|nr:SIS domain-containing protein [Galactobacter sp.]